MWEILGPVKRTMLTIKRGKRMQLLWLEVGWAGMEEGQGVRSGAEMSLSLLHSCHSNPPGDGFSSFSGFANGREVLKLQFRLTALLPTEPATFTWSMDD